MLWMRAKGIMSLLQKSCKSEMMVWQMRSKPVKSTMKCLSQKSCKSKTVVLLT